MRVCIAVALAVLVTVCVAHPPKWHQLSSEYTFERYVADFDKGYVQGSSEWKARRDQFHRSLATILAHNANPGVTWHMGVNHMTDLFDAEFNGMLGARHTPDYHGETRKDYVAHDGALKKAVDYRNSTPAVLTAVKDQGFCGDCWAHAVTEAIESSHAIRTGNLYVLSQQQVTSCTPKVGSCYSCNGSYPRIAYDYVAQAKHGLVQEWNYPFESYNASFPACKHHTLLPQYPYKTRVKIDGFIQVGPNNQQATMAALNHLGPLSILVDAMPWMHYEGGIFTNCGYNKNSTLDHAVQLVGYGSDEATGKDYWIVRNSWSPAWGEHGFIRLERTATEQCGLNYGGMTCYGTGRPTRMCGCSGVLSDPQFPIPTA